MRLPVSDDQHRNRAGIRRAMRAVCPDAGLARTRQRMPRPPTGSRCRSAILLSKKARSRKYRHCRVVYFRLGPFGDHCPVDAVDDAQFVARNAAVRASTWLIFRRALSLKPGQMSNANYWARAADSGWQRAIFKWA